MVQDQLNSLTQELKALKNQSKKTQEVIDALKNESFVNSHLYVNKLTFGFAPDHSN